MMTTELLLYISSFVHSFSWIIIIFHYKIFKSYRKVLGLVDLSVGQLERINRTLIENYM